MKKIKNISQLQSEKKKIKIHQQNLEDEIHYNWHELKETLKPSNVAKDALNKVIQKSTQENLNDESIFKSTFSYIASLLAKKVANKLIKK